MRYPVTIEADGASFLVTFIDIPEAITQGSNIAEALEMAKDALETALTFYLEDGRSVPLPSPVELGQPYVILNDFRLGENVVASTPTAIK